MPSRFEAPLARTESGLLGREAVGSELHHKFAVFDGRTLITGSYNWTRSAARDNQENLIVVSDQRLVAAFHGELDKLWAKFGSAA